MKTNFVNLVLAGSLASGLFGNVKNVEAQETKDLGLSARAKVEYFGDMNDQNNMTYRLGIGPKGIYDGRFNLPGQFLEKYRFVYSHNLENGNDLAMVGARLKPSQEFGYEFLPSDALVFGGLAFDGNVLNVGTESKWNVGDLTVRLRGEGDSSGKSHVGGTVSYQLGNVLFQAGSDHVFSRDWNQLYGNITLFHSSNDLTGMTYTHNSDGLNMLRVTSCHFNSKGTETNWGHRSYAEYQWNNDSNVQAVKGQTIIVPFGSSTFIKDAGMLMQSPNWDDTGLFQITETPTPLDTESVLRHDRLVGARNGGLEGLGFSGDFSWSSSGSNENTSLGVNAHYITRLSERVGQNELGISIGSSFTFGDSGDNAYLNAGATLRLGKNIEAEASVRTGLDNNEFRLQGGLQYGF